MNDVPEGMKPKTPPEPNHTGKGKQPKLLTDAHVKVLLAYPNTWFLIGESNDWISGVKKNIESMTQRNIRHLKDVGKFSIAQRINTDNDCIDIYCKFITNTTEEE